MIKLGKTLACVAIATSILSACSSPTTGGDSTQSTNVSTSKEVLTVTETTSEVTSADTVAGTSTATEVSSEEAEFIELALKLEPSLKILEPDSIGSIYVEGTFLNSTESPIVAYELTYKDLGTKETHYLSTYDTVMPGEVSSKFETFGPESGKVEDIQFLELSFTLKIEDTEVIVEYDYQLEEVELDMRVPE